jgi:hypothetical protein
VDGVPIVQPPIDTTVAQTTVSARSGQTVILGGLITKERETVSRRVPYLADIPLLGDLFKYDSESDLRTELLIIMTPHIVRKPEDSDALNQIESERMSWCLADVIDVHGDAGLSSGGINRQGLQLIYPDLDPTGTGGTILQSIEEVPAPASGNASEPTEIAPPRTSDKSSRRLSQRVAHLLSPKSKKSKSDSESRSIFKSVNAPKEQTLDDSFEPFVDESIQDGAADPAEPPTPDDVDVAPASYVPEKQKQESRWKKLRKKLPFSR